MRRLVLLFVGVGLEVFHFKSKTTCVGDAIELCKRVTEGLGLVG